MLAHSEGSDAEHSGDLFVHLPLQFLFNAQSTEVALRLPRIYSGPGLIRFTNQ